MRLSHIASLFRKPFEESAPMRDAPVDEPSDSRQHLHLERSRSCSSSNSLNSSSPKRVRGQVRQILAILVPRETHLCQGFWLAICKSNSAGASDVASWRNLPVVKLFPVALGWCPNPETVWVSARVNTQTQITGDPSNIFKNCRC